MITKKCPVCGSINLSDDHLIIEYKNMLRAGFDRTFGHNARKACNIIVDLLAEHGITSYPGIFGINKIRKWTY